MQMTVTQIITAAAAIITMTTSTTKNSKEVYVRYYLRQGKRSEHWQI